MDGYYSIGRGTLDYVTVRYGGQSYGGFNFNLGVERGGNLTVTHSMISNSSGYGVYVDNSSGLTFTNNLV